MQAGARGREEATDALLDAAERLLVQVGHAGDDDPPAGGRGRGQQGLVHYYFGSMEELFLQVLERFTDRLVERQREMYAADAPFIDKWRAAMRFLEDDLEAGYHKMWLELQAMAWNNPAMRTRLAAA